MTPSPARHSIDPNLGVEVTLRNGIVLHGKLERVGGFGQVLKVERYKRTATGLMKKSGTPLVLGLAHNEETLRGITRRKIASLLFDPSTMTLSIEE